MHVVKLGSKSKSFANIPNEVNFGKVTEKMPLVYRNQFSYRFL